MQPSVDCRSWQISWTSYRYRETSSHEIEVVVQTGPSYRAELSWLTARAPAYELLKLTEEIAHAPRRD